MFSNLVVKFMFLLMKAMPLTREGSCDCSVSTVLRSLAFEGYCVSLTPLSLNPAPRFRHFDRKKPKLNFSFQVNARRFNFYYTSTQYEVENSQLLI